MPAVVFTERGMIRTVAARWHAQYDNHPIYGRDKQHISVALDALDVEAASAEDVEAIMGNRSWTRLSCNNCGASDLKCAVQVGEVADYESATAVLCLNCADEAYRELRRAAA